MDSTQLKKFMHTADERTQLTSIRKNLKHSIHQWRVVLPKGQSQFKDMEATRALANSRKQFAMQNLPYLLEDFEKNITANGAKVLWAKNKAEAQAHILDICVRKKCKMIVKSKSMATEEIHLNAHLEKHGITAYETDLGEFIQQMAGEDPIHIVTPAMHRSKEEVAELFHKKLHVHEGLTPEQLTTEARNYLRAKYMQAEVGISGANFILPDIGGIAITENEGNGRLSVGGPTTHILLVGIEKMIPSFKDLSLFWPLLAAYGTGQYITSYSTIVTGPRKDEERDGPEEMYVILMDNGRTEIFADPVQRESLFCIRCGSCLNQCPVYTSLAGGHGYNTTYSGPIGSVISPHLRGMGNYGHLAYASSLCGACTQVCPVKIPLHNLLLHTRIKMVEAQHTTLKESMVWAAWSSAMRHPWVYTWVPTSLKKMGMGMFGKVWTKYRAPVPFAKKTFREVWKQRRRRVV